MFYNGWEVTNKKVDRFNLLSMVLEWGGFDKVKESRSIQKLSLCMGIDKNYNLHRYYIATLYRYEQTLDSDKYITSSEISSRLDAFKQGKRTSIPSGSAE